MSKITISLIIGATAGIIDIIPMFLQKLDRYSIISAFIQWVVAGFVITHIQFGIGGWLKGFVIAVAMALPVIVLIVKTDAKAAAPILVMSMILGGLVGFASDKFVR